jgi:hypothetical protein
LWSDERGRENTADPVITYVSILRMIVKNSTRIKMHYLANIFHNHIIWGQEVMVCQSKRASTCMPWGSG